MPSSIDLTQSLALFVVYLKQQRQDNDLWSKMSPPADTMGRRVVQTWWSWTSKCSLDLSQTLNLCKVWVVVVFFLPENTAQALFMSTVDAAVMLWLCQILFSSQLRGALQVNRVDQKDDHVIVYLGEVRRHLHLQVINSAGIDLDSFFSSNSYHKTYQYFTPWILYKRSPCRTWSQP